MRVDGESAERSLKGKGGGEGQRVGKYFVRVVGMERVNAAIPPVVARIFSGDSTSPLTGRQGCWCEAKNGADAKAYKHT